MLPSPDAFDRLTKFLEVAPENLTLSVAQIWQMLGKNAAQQAAKGIEMEQATEAPKDRPDPSHAPSPDYTVRQIAELENRKPSTVTSWIRSGELEAYWFMDYEYRITPEDYAAFKESQRKRGARKKRSSPGDRPSQNKKKRDWRDIRNVPAKD